MPTLHQVVRRCLEDVLVRTQNDMKCISSRPLRSFAVLVLFFKIQRSIAVELLKGSMIFASLAVAAKI